MHVFICNATAAEALLAELERAFPSAQHVASHAGLVQSNDIVAAAPVLAFATQVLPEARAAQASSISAWVDVLAEALQSLPPATPWRLHLFALPVHGPRPRR